MKDIETITIDGAMYSEPWKKHELNDIVRVEMDYHSLAWCCYLIQLINKTVDDRLEYELIHGTDEKSTDTLATEEAVLILRLERIKREILSNEGRDAYYLAAIDKAIVALSKQSASSEQADTKPNQPQNGSIHTEPSENDEDRTTDDQCGDGAGIINLKKRTITERLIIANSLIASAIADSDNNQFRDETKMTDDVTDMNDGDMISRRFVELLAEYHDPEICPYKEYKGKPYFSIKYIENGEEYIGYGTYSPKVLSQYLREYFMVSAQPEWKPGKWLDSGTGGDQYNAYYLYKCSECKSVFDNKSNFCPNCGADMRGEQDENR